jgi:hypothetical protein
MSLRSRLGSGISPLRRLWLAIPRRVELGSSSLNRLFVGRVATLWSSASWHLLGHDIQLPFDFIGSIIELNRVLVTMVRSMTREFCKLMWVLPLLLVVGQFIVNLLYLFLHLKGAIGL